MWKHILAIGNNTRLLASFRSFSVCNSDFVSFPFVSHNSLCKCKQRSTTLKKLGNRDKDGPSFAKVLSTSSMVVLLISDSASVTATSSLSTKAVFVDTNCESSSFVANLHIVSSRDLYSYRFKTLAGTELDSITSWIFFLQF